jgi:hypothetical protein
MKIGKTGVFGGVCLCFAVPMQCGSTGLSFTKGPQKRWDRYV